MRLIDRYLLRELASGFAAAGVVLVLTSATGVLADLLRRIALGKIPASLLLSQFGLRLVDALPTVMPLALFIGTLLCYARLYRDGEMAVLAAAGLGPRQLLRPALVLGGATTAVVAGLSLWAAPAAVATSRQMIEEANRSLLVAGLEPGRFVELPGRQSVVYLGGMSTDGSRFERLFVHSRRGDRIDLVTARRGALFTESVGEERFLRLEEGFRIEGVPGRNDFRVMRFARNDLRVPGAEPGGGREMERRLPTLDLLREAGPGHRAELHWRLAAPIATLALCLLAVPLARSPPRASRYGGLLLALLSYLVYLNLLVLGRSWIASGDLPVGLGLWWVHAPVLAMAGYLLWRHDHPRPRRTR
ncbi:MAG: LPS export ABC transporter permease LptF [Lysobacteraceae bacterium]|nr:MAG: LPS export ABC transporter permease LptF [Xanthomonadaceae bacterium]